MHWMVIQMTNREKLNTYSDDKLYDAWSYIFLVFGKQFTNSRLGVVKWLSDEYDKDHWIWMMLDGGSKIENREMD